MTLKQIKIREGFIKDLDRITAIEERVFKIPWSREQILFELERKPAGKTLVMEVKGKLIGYLISIVDENKVKILNIAIDIPRQHRGYGKLLLYQFLEQFGKSTEAVLEVKRSNLNAIKLYIDAGFKEVGVHDKYYEDGEDAIIMKIEK